MSNPFGMAEFSVPQLLGLDMQMKDRRLQQMYMAKQQDRDDKRWEREEKKGAREDATYDAYSKAFAPTPTAPASGAAPQPSQAPAATSSFRADPEKLNALRATGPDGFKAASEIEKMSAERLKDAQEGMGRMLELKGRIIGGVRALPPEQREQAYQAERQQLIANGADPNTLPPKWDESAADQMVRSALTAAEALGMDDKARAFAEQVRHNRASEGNAAGNLALSRQREARVKQWGPQPMFGVTGINPNAPADNSDLDY